MCEGSHDTSWLTESGVLRDTVLHVFSLIIHVQLKHLLTLLTITLYVSQ